MIQILKVILNIFLNLKKEYVINDEALEFISGVPAPIGVVGVNYFIY